MITQLRVRNYAVARDISLELGDGLTVFTGETGSGKSLVVDALGFAFGARAGREVIGAGAERASVAVDFDGVHVERSIGLAGRSSCLVDGVAATIDNVRALGERMIEIHSQAGQLGLLKPAAQLEVLDRFGGIVDEVAKLAQQIRDLRRVRRRIESLQTDAKEYERTVDRLRFEVDEIEGAALQAGEVDALRVEQHRLANADLLRTEAATGIEVLESEQLGTLAAAIRSIGERDRGAAAVGDMALLLESTLDDLRRELRAYSETLEEDPERLQSLTERLDLIARLRRKYGDSIEAIKLYADSAREQLDAMVGAGEDLDGLRSQESELAAVAVQSAQAVSERRREAARRLVEETAGELEKLGMGLASLAIGFECRDADGGLEVVLPDYETVDGGSAPAARGGEPVARAFTESGVDRVEFLASFNPGLPPRPLSEVASGGETSRFLLALTAVFGNAAEPRTIVLDEVDEGVGGRAGAMVGEALARLARRHQVLCITHLPQVAAFADHHFVVTKASDARTTWSMVRAVEREERVAELANMLGGETAENLAAARSLLDPRTVNR